MAYRYFLIAVAAAALLLGIQVPNFITQYSQRLDAHVIEVDENLRGFQRVADQFHGGSLEALVRHHEASGDASFRAEAEPIRAMAERQRMWHAEQRALDTHLAGQAMHLALRGNRTLLAETRAAYSFNIPLNRQAVFAGLAAAIGAVLAVELVAGLLRALFGRPRRDRRTSRVAA